MITRNSRSLAIVLAVLGVAACGDSTPSQPVPPVPPTAPAGEGAAVKAPPPPTPTQLLMRAHFEKAIEARSALIADDMDAARTAMAWLAGNDAGQEGLPEALRPHLAGMREKAGTFAAATTFSQAGEAFAGMLTHCGDCHAEAHTGPRFPDTAAPQGTELRDRMRKHAWAADRMWEGLILRDQARYDDAARSLADVVVRAEELPANTNDPARVQAVADNVRALAAAGLASTDWPSRAQTYGKFLATCATCHRMMGVRSLVRAGLVQQPAAQPLPPAPR